MPVLQDTNELSPQRRSQERLRIGGLAQPWIGEIVPKVFRLGTTYVGCYVVEEAGAYTFIDTGLPGYWQQILGFLAMRNAPLSAVKAVVLTHSHVDHLGNAERLRKEAVARVLIHEADLALATRKASPPRWPFWRPRVLRYFLHALRGGAVQMLPVVEASTFVDGEILDVPGRPRVIHTPGHTAGHSAIHMEEREVLFVGDALATIDIPTGEVGPRLMPRYMNDDYQAALQSLRNIEDVRAGWVLAAHGMPWEGTPRQAVDFARRLVLGLT
jgi:glyoxylase-like metal-dependent hydrolase (beta-lactamase superfamily II)